MVPSGLSFHRITQVNSVEFFSPAWAGPAFTISSAISPNSKLPENQQKTFFQEV